MTKIEFGLILAIIDKHTKTFVPNYYPDGVRRTIEDVDSLKADLTDHFNTYMVEDNVK